MLYMETRPTVQKCSVRTARTQPSLTTLLNESKQAYKTNARHKW